jgi:hypothetical protein
MRYYSDMAYCNKNFDFYIDIQFFWGDDFKVIIIHENKKIILENPSIKQVQKSIDCIFKIGDYYGIDERINYTELEKIFNKLKNLGG